MSTLPYQGDGGEGGNSQNLFIWLMLKAKIKKLPRSGNSSPNEDLSVFSGNWATASVTV
jgi:hypothetical protein